MTVDELHARLSQGEPAWMRITELWSPATDAIRINVSRKEHAGAQVHLPTLGNPYYRSGQMQRGDTIQQYRRWLATQVKTADSAQLQALDEIIKHLRVQQPVELACWCKQPGPCHAHVIAKAVCWRILHTDPLPAEILC